MKVHAAGLMWPNVPLREVLELKYGKSLSSAARTGEGFPVYGSNGVVGAHEIALTDGPTIVVGRKGSYGQINYSADKCWPIDTTYYVDATCTSADLRWLAHLLPTLGLDQMNKSAAVPGLSRDDAYRVTIQLPPFNEQKRIAAILDKADELRTKRRQALAHLDVLTQSIFHEMFGKQEWESTALGSIATFRYGSSNKSAPRGRACLRIPNISRRHVDWNDIKYVPVTDDELSRLKLETGDLLFVRSNGNPEFVGRSAVFEPRNDEDVIFASYLIRARFFNNDQATPLFVNAFLGTARGRDQLRSGAKTSAGQYNINTQALGDLKIPLPPLGLQETFASRVAALERLKESHRGHLAELDALFASLQHRAFKGEL